MERRDAIYENLRDLRFEYRAGKFSEKDYEEIKQSLEVEAARVLAEMDQLTGGAPTPATRQGFRETPTERAAAKGAQIMKSRESPACQSYARNLDSGSAPQSRRCRRCAVLLLAASVPLALTARFAGTVTGTVNNGTTGKPAAGADMILIQLQGGMQPVANTKTDAQGHYSFDNPQLGAGPMLIRAVYHGVNYHEPITPGKTTSRHRSLRAHRQADAFTVANHAIILQPNGSDLMVGEEYIITNKTQPPLAFYRADGSFDFTLPDGAHFNQVSAWGSSGMPVMQSTIDKGKNKRPSPFRFAPAKAACASPTKFPTPAITSRCATSRHTPASA